MCLSVNTWEGVPHLHPIILPLYPCAFWGMGYPSDWSQVPSGGTPVLGGGTRVPGRSTVVTGGRYLQARQNWGTPCHNWGNTPPTRHYRTGVPCSEDWGTPPWRLNTKESTWYVVGGMPFAFKQEDFLV